MVFVRHCRSPCDHLIFLSTRRYTFVWETTILSLGSLEYVAKALSFYTLRLVFRRQRSCLINPDATDNLACMHCGQAAILAKAVLSMDYWYVGIKDLY